MTADRQEARLRAAFAADEPPARDYVFTAEVMQRVARRRLQISLLMLAPPMLAAMAVLWSVAPTVETVAADLMGGLAPAIAVTTATLFLTLAGLRLLRPRSA